ncbi:glutathione S-transferase family protein [Candidatus Kaiserbacteria bacterium]|nr:glutathione S-transferase family protein [Candidatus Kaiserbacteria bacterium]
MRIMLYLKGVEYEVVEEPLRVWTDWMREWSKDNNERPRVPVLRIDDVVYTESNEINLMLDEDKEYTPEDITEMRKWFSWCDDVLKPQIDLYKYGANLQFDTEENKGHEKKLREMLQKLEDTLKEKTYLMEERLTVVDIAIIPFVRQIMRTRNGVFDFTSFPHIVSWANTVLETDWFQNEVMKKRQ